MTTQANRNALIQDAYRQGIDPSNLAKSYCLTRQRIHQIVGLISDRTEKTLKQRAQEVLDFIITYKQDHDGNSPTMRQICEGCGILSTSHVSLILRHLEERGKIRFSEKYHARNIEIVGGRWSLEL